jgi:P-type Cu+ transporter
MLAVEGQLAGILAIFDPIKTDALAAVTELKKSGIHLIMATGDGLATATYVAEKLGIDEIHAAITPKKKLSLVEKLQRTDHTVAMVGDGINDAPALAKANVGIAMGTGTDVAINSAQITLVKGELNGICRALRISHQTVQNMAFAFIYNALGIALAAGALFAFTGWLLSPMVAALAMSLSSVSVIANALRLQSSSAFK